MQKIKFTFIIVTLCIIACVESFAQSAPISNSNDFTTNIKSLGKIPKGFNVIAPSIKFGPELNHVAYAAYKDKNHKILRFDDTTLPGVYHAIQPGHPVFSPDGKQLAYIVYSGDMGQNSFAVVDGKKGPVFDYVDQFMFSPDGSRYVYRAVKGKKQCVVMDGVQGQYYDGIPIDKNFKFSPDSKIFAYVGYMDGKCVMIENGIKKKHTFQFIKDVTFSFDSKHIAYKARVEKNGNKEKWRVVYDGTLQNVYDRIFDLVFSYDSKHLAYPAVKNRRMALVVDGVEIEKQAGVGIPVFSPDSATLSYAYTKNNTWHMVINGNTGPGYESLGKFYYSYNSKRYAYFAKNNDKWFCFVDGKKNKTGFEKGMDIFKFSLDSKHYAYAGIHEKGASIVYDGKPGPVYISVGEPYFSLDSKHMVYRARRKNDGKWQTVLDGRVSQKAYNAIGKYYFSDDSRHLAYNALININKSVMVVDGMEQCGKNNFKIISEPHFSPDSKHMAYYVRAGKNIWKIVVDGKILPETYAGFMKATPLIFDTPNRFHTIGFRMPGPEFVRVEVEIPESSGIKTSITETITK